NTMGMALILEGIAIYLMLQYRADPFMLVLLSGLVFFGWGEIFSLFPSTLTDTFGTKYATTNYGFLYMAQGVGSILGAPVAAMIYEATGNWMTVFGLVIGMDILTRLLALFVLKYLRRAWLARAAQARGWRKGRQLPLDQMRSGARSGTTAAARGPPRLPAAASRTSAQALRAHGVRTSQHREPASADRCKLAKLG